MAKVMISMPEELLASLDAEASAREVTRSALIAQAVRREISSPDAARVDELLSAARSVMKETGAWSAEDLVRNERDTH
jgi:metal-responsive CopG/Arc/MetJ family transcriptional regulator